jgi:hypothetical protein
VFLYSYPTPVSVLYYCSCLLCMCTYPVLVIWCKVMWIFAVLHFADVCSFLCMCVLYCYVGFLLVSCWIELNSFEFYESKTGLYLGYRTIRKYITYIIVVRFPNCKKRVRFQENLLSLNVSKTYFLQFHNKN